MHIWIFQTGEPVHTDSDELRPMRAMNLSNAFIQRGHKVTLITSNFFHQKKIRRFSGHKLVRVSNLLEIQFIDSPGYKNNIGLARLIDHFFLYYNLKKIIFRNTIPKPDLIFIGFPPIETAYFLINYAKEHNIFSILDLKDQWPYIFLEKFPRYLRPLAYVLFFPYFYITKKTFKNALAMCSMSDSFLNWGMSISGRNPSSNDFILPLVTENNTYNLSKKEIDEVFWGGDIGLNLNSNKRFCFAGSISQAFDFSPIKKAAEYFLEKDKSVEIVICGDGQEYRAIKNSLCKYRNIFFTGWINKNYIEQIMSISVATLAPYRNIDNFKLNLPNKIIDSLSNGLPIITSLQGEVEALINKYEVGFFCNNTNWHKSMEILLHDDKKRQLMINNAKRLYKNKFSYEKVYLDFVKKIELL